MDLKINLRMTNYAWRKVKLLHISSMVKSIHVEIAELKTKDNAIHIELKSSCFVSPRVTFVINSYHKTKNENCS